MSNAIDQMKKTLDANKTHVENALKETANAPVKKSPPASSPKSVAKNPPAKAPPAKSPPAKKSANRIYPANKAQFKPATKRFTDVYEKAVTPKAPAPQKQDKPEVTVRVEVNNHQIPPWESPSTVVSVQAPNIPETVVVRQQLETIPSAPYDRGLRYEDQRPRERSLSSQSRSAAVMGVLGSGFRSVSPTIKR